MTDANPAKEVDVARLLVLVVGIALGAIAAGCGGDEDEGCPGITCNNCAVDCDIACGPGEQETCVSADDFGGDPDLRCAYCQ